MTENPDAVASAQQASPDLTLPDPRDELVLGEARRAIDQQKKDLEGLRNRAGATVGFATVVASVIGGLTLGGEGTLSVWTFLGFASLAAGFVLSAFVLFPRKLTLVMDAATIDSWIDNGDSTTQMSRSVALGIIAEYDKNASILLRMHWAYAAAMTAVLSEALLLLIDLVTRR